MKRLLLGAALALSACTPVSTVGPFVTNVTRVRAGLMIESCEIVLRGSDLSAGRCGSWVVPIDNVAPLPPPGPPGTTQLPMGAAPLPPVIAPPPPPRTAPAAPPAPPKTSAAQALTPAKLAELIASPPPSR